MSDSVGTGRTTRLKSRTRLSSRNNHSDSERSKSRTRLYNHSDSAESIHRRDPSRPIVPFKRVKDPPKPFNFTKLGFILSCFIAVTVFGGLSFRTPDGITSETTDVDSKLGKPCVLNPMYRSLAEGAGVIVQGFQAQHRRIDRFLANLYEVLSTDAPALEHAEITMCLYGTVGTVSLTTTSESVEHLRQSLRSHRGRLKAVLEESRQGMKLIEKHLELRPTALELATIDGVGKFLERLRKATVPRLKWYSGINTVTNAAIMTLDATLANSGVYDGRNGSLTSEEARELTRPFVLAMESLYTTVKQVP